MPQLVEPTTLDAQRQIIRKSLSEIANDISMALRDAGLSFPVFMTVRDNGDSLATIATPLDPSDDDWSCAAAIVCDILEKRIDGAQESPHLSDRSKNVGEERLLLQHLGEALHQRAQPSITHGWQ
jgi:hypothetical protein